MSVKGMGATRCDLATSSTPGSCIDPRALKGQTLTVPSNVTRIGEQGLALCTPTTVQSLSADIAYIVDNSSSMSVTSFWVDSTTKDTSWYVQDCLEDMRSPVGTWVPLRLRHYGATTGADSLSVDSLFQLSAKPRSCLESRDPYNMRGQAVRVAIDYQAQFDSGSMAGVVYFNRNVTQKFPMRALDAKGRRGLVDSVGMYRAASGTYWAPPFQTSMDWLEDINTGRNEIIILVSDGEPFDSAAYTRLLGKAGQPPIYAIYLGTSNERTPQLDRVTTLTNGKKFVVPPDRPDSLEGIIKSIVASVTRKDAPTASSLTNATNGQSSRTLAVRSDTLETWRLQLDSVVSLVPGLNYLVSVTNWKGTIGLGADTSVFIVNVAGPSAPLGETPVAGAALGAQCFEGTTMRFVDSAFDPIYQAVEGGGPVGVALLPSGSPNLPLRVNLATGAGDAEVLALNKRDSIAPGSWARTIPLNVARVTPVAPGSNALDVRSGYDTLRAAWCHSRDARDCAEAYLPVTAIRGATLRWIPESLPGSQGAFVLESVLPGQGGTGTTAIISRRGIRIGSVTLTRVQDSLYRGTVPFSQGPRRPGGDTLWLNAPSGTIPDTLVASVVWKLDNSTIVDTATIIRPPLSLSAQRVDSGYMVELTLVGGMPDARGIRVGSVYVSSVQTGVFDSTGRTRIDLQSQLTRASGSQVTVYAWFVDPVYGDTAFANTEIPVPSRSIRFLSNSVMGPRGSLGVELRDPWATAPTRDVLLQHGNDAFTVRLTRTGTGIYTGTVLFTQLAAATGDTIALGKPRMGKDSVYIILPAQDSLPAKLDLAYITRPPLSLSMAAQAERPQWIDLALKGGMADARGEAHVVLTGPVAIPRSRLSVAGDLVWSGLSQLDTILPESRDSIDLRGMFVDPLYGDTVFAFLRVKSPWFPATITATPKTVDPREGDTLEIRVKDKDVRPDKVDTVVVMAGKVRLKLIETGKSTGEFVRRVPAGAVDPQWTERDARRKWETDLVYIDANNPSDSVSTRVVLKFEVPPPVAEPVEPLLPVVTESRPGKPHLEVIRPGSDGRYPKGAQGVELKVWEHTRTMSFVYDKIGTFVTSWEGVLDTEDPKVASRYLLKWDGCEQDGTPTAPGIYLIRVIMVGDDGAPLGNYVFTVGRRARKD